MLYVLFGFFGASIGSAVGFAIGLLEPQWFDQLMNPAVLADGQWGLDLVNSCSIGLIFGGVLGGGVGLVTARKISRKK